MQDGFGLTGGGLIDSTFARHILHKPPNLPRMVLTTCEYANLSTEVKGVWMPKLSVVCNIYEVI